MFTKENSKLAVCISLVLVFAAMLAFNLMSYVLVDFFLLALMLVLFKKITLKMVVLVLSPFLIYPAMLFGAPLAASLVFGILYAYLFRDMLRDRFEPSLRWTGFCLAWLLVAASFFASVVVVSCYGISRSEKGVTVHEVSWCQKYGQYQPTFHNIFFESGYYLQGYTLLPSMIILIGMGIGYAIGRKTHGKENRP